MFQCCYSALGEDIFLGWFLKEVLGISHTVCLSVCLSLPNWEPPGLVRFGPSLQRAASLQNMMFLKLISKGAGGSHTPHPGGVGPVI